MSRKVGGVGYGLLLVGLAVVAVLLVAWLVDPAVMPGLVRERVCVAP